ncbi:MAG: ribosome small subunit-dependent GTPase A [Neisseria sp.]|nr:ribosome small subunit-dependent GTPase A [Neisseria sp.]
MLSPAQIVEDYGRRYVIRLPEKTLLEATTRKKRVDFACGDEVLVQPLNETQAVIEELLPRRSLLFRQDAYKTKLFAANVTQVLIVAAAVPAPSEELIQRTLLAAEAAGIQAALVLNKSDLPESTALQHAWAYYREVLHVPMLAVSALSDVTALRAQMQGHCNILIGQSGMGKSTLTNALLGEDVARTGTISVALAAGRHTTTHTRLYDLDDKTTLIDSPGLQSFGLHHLNAAELLHDFPDMRHLIGQCRFHNCTHRQEPDCALKAAVLAGSLPEARLAFLQKITDEIG